MRAAMSGQFQPSCGGERRSLRDRFQPAHESPPVVRLFRRKPPLYEQDAAQKTLAAKNDDGGQITASGVGRMGTLPYMVIDADDLYMFS